MAFTNRCRPHVAAIVRRLQNTVTSSSVISARSHLLAGNSPGRPFGNVPCLNPSFGGVYGNRRHFSWWRWGGSSSDTHNGQGLGIPEASSSAVHNGQGLGIPEASGSAVHNGQGLGIPEASGSAVHYGQGSGIPEASTIRQEDEIGDGVEQVELEPFPWQSNVEIHHPESVVITSTDGMLVEGGGGNAFWSTLQVPVDAIVVTLDRFQTATQVPWWLTIIGSSLALRAALFPLTVTQLRKASLFARLGSQLPPPVPPPGSGQTLASQYRIFTKRRLELGAPSPAWLIAVPLIQVPLFIYWIVSVRQMAMAAHPGFDTGGILWFTDLTVPVQGALGSLFPIIVAATYFTNLQLSFKGIEQQKGIMGTVMKFYKWWLEAATIPAFIFGFYLPQGVFMYWITNNCCSLAQTIALRQPSVRAALGLPSLSELATLRSPPPSPSPETSSLKMEAVENMSSDDLLVLAANCVSMQKEDEALEVLHHTVKKFPDKVEALFALGKIYSGRQQWLKASEYHGLVLQKTKEKELIIAASLGAGVALFNLGKRSEALEIMSVFSDMDVPQDPLSQHRYFKACVALSSVLSQEGRKVEALNLLKKAAKYEPMVEKVFIPQLEKELQQERT